MKHLKHQNKNNPYTSKAPRGFTLVELLVVIAIIMVLAALGFAGTQAVLTKARNTKALVVCNNIEQAVTQYFDEYTSLPILNAQETPIVSNQGEGINVITALMGKEQPTANQLNTKNLPFLQIPQGKGVNGSGRRDGIQFEGGGGGAVPRVVGVFDFFGNPYTMIFDADGNDEILDPFSPGQIIRGRKVIVYTPGKDLRTGDARTNRDNIISWK